MLLIFTNKYYACCPNMLGKRSSWRECPCTWRRGSLETALQQTCGRVLELRQVLISGNHSHDNDNIVLGIDVAKIMDQWINKVHLEPVPVDRLLIDGLCYVDWIPSLDCHRNWRWHSSPSRSIFRDWTRRSDREWDHLVSDLTHVHHGRLMFL